MFVNQIYEPYEQYMNFINDNFTIVVPTVSKLMTGGRG